MMRDHTHWICAIDARRGRLFRGRMTPPGRCHVDEIDTIECHAPEPERGRPSPRNGRNGRAYSPEGHDSDERLHRFAKSAMDWLMRQVQHHNLDQITLFAPPRVLGELRKLKPNHTNGLFREHEADIAHLGPSQLARQPAIQELLQSRRQAHP